MALTYRQAINRVLRAVSEEEIDDSVLELTDDYHKLVGTFVNLIKEEIEEAHQWRALRQTLSVTMTAATNVATITGANDRSSLVYVQDARLGAHVPLVYDVTNANAPFRMKELDMALLIDQDSLNTQPATEASHFAIDNASGDVMRLRVYPTPSVQRSYEVTMTVPQDRFEDDELDTTIRIPTRALEIGSIWYALEERGEELGVGGVFTEERYRKAVDDAVTRDAEAQGGYELVPT